MKWGDEKKDAGKTYKKLKEKMHNTHKNRGNSPLGRPCPPWDPPVESAMEKEGGGRKIVKMRKSGLDEAGFFL